MSFSYQILIMMCFYCFNKQSNISRDQFIFNHNAYLSECLRTDPTQYSPNSNSTITIATSTTNSRINLNECFNENTPNEAEEFFKHHSLFDQNFINLIKSTIDVDV